MLNSFLKEKNSPYIATFFISLVLSYMAVSTDNLLNHDAIYFMNSAKIYLRDGFAALLKVFSWPFYSWLVATAHQISWMPHIEQTAHFINALFIAAICVLFIRIYAEVTNHEGSLWVAAILILALTGINKYRADVMKDFGYWLFYLAGFYCLLRYYKRPGWLAAIGWQLFTLLAFLFRIEGVVIIVLGPLVMFLKEGVIRDRAVQAVSLYGVYIVGLVISSVILLFVDYGIIHSNLGRINNLADFMDINSFIESFDKSVRKLGEVYTYEGAHLKKKYGILASVYMFGLFGYVVTKIVGCVSFPYFSVFLYGTAKKHISLSDANKIILFFMAFLFSFFYVFMIKGAVLTSRYTTSLVLLLLLLLGQVVEHLIPTIKKSKHKVKIATGIFVYLFITTIDSTISTQGDSKDYIFHAGYWVKDNTVQTTPVYSNYYKVLYYTDREISLQKRIGIEELITAVESESLEQGVFLVAHIHQEDKEIYKQRLGKLVTANKIEFLKEFMNDDSDRLIVYKVQ